MMSSANAGVNWFDLLVIGLVALGIYQGRKRGLSEELLQVLQWLCIVVLGALLYGPVASLYSLVLGTPALFSNMLGYVTIALLIKLCFTTMKRAVGEKLVHSDAFGRFEYYLGMMAGITRCLCVLLFALSFLHAKQITDQERAATARMQAENFGSITFPTVGSLQQTIFHDSVTGKFIRKNLHAQLMQPAMARGRQGGGNIGQQRSQMLDEVMR